MKIIGISGLDNAVSFKKTKFPGLIDRQYRLIQGADAAAALIVDGEIVAAAAEERFNGRKHCNDFPKSAVSYCLEQAGLSLDDVDEIVRCFDYDPYRDHYAVDAYGIEYFDQVYANDGFVRTVQDAFPGFPKERIGCVDHHLSHAASAYWLSGWDECLVAVIDGMGEVNAATVYQAKDGIVRPLGTLPGEHSFGIFYSVLTYLLGFDFNADEYKVMGLAPYGDPHRFREFFDREVRLTSDGFCRIPMLSLNREPVERDNYLGTLQYLSKTLVPPREPESEIQQVHRDIAAGLQAKCNELMLHICRYYAEETGLRRMAIAGGVAQNCTANGEVLRAGIFDEIYIGPAAGDDGAALGAALHRAALVGEVRNVRSGLPFYGPGYDTSEIETAISRFGDQIDVVRFADFGETCVQAAADLAARQVIGWYHGRMEFGARALGNRSILADATHPDMRERVNKMVKKRESFRPFAPAVSEEFASDWFDLPPGGDFSFMTIIANVRSDRRDRLPAVTHVDGSARIQTVSRTANPCLHGVIDAVRARTGVPIVLNTSFNVRGQPIVDSPGDAIATFLRTAIDSLYLHNCKLTRKDASWSSIEAADD